MRLNQGVASCTYVRKKITGLIRGMDKCRVRGQLFKEFYTRNCKEGVVSQTVYGVI